MELLLKLREELKSIRERFYNLVEPEKQIAEKVESFVHAAVDQMGAFHALLNSFEDRVKAVEASVEQRVHEALVKAGIAKPEDAPTPTPSPTPAPVPDPQVPSADESAAAPSAPAAPEAAGSAVADTAPSSTEAAA